MTLVVACGAVSVPAQAAGEDFYGVNAQALFDLPRGKVDGHLQQMADAGLQIVRRDASWDAAEPAPPDSIGRHTYRWERFDREVSAYARHNLRWLPVISYSTPWAASLPGDPFSPPARVEDYAAYAGAVAGRYGSGGSFWREHPDLPERPATSFEIWNEPNAELFWHPQRGAARRYAELFLAARDAIRDVDPAARIMIGGLAPAGPEVTDEHAFVEAMFEHRPELRDGVDAIALHPYAPDADGVLARIRAFRQTLDELGLGRVPIEVTEVGWTTTETPERERASFLRRLVEELPQIGSNVTSLIPHTWVTAEEDPSDREQWFGIYNADGSPKPSGEAYLGAVR